MRRSTFCSRSKELARDRALDDRRPNRRPSEGLRRIFDAGLKFRRDRVGADLTSVLADVDAARAETGSYWLDETAKAHTAWLSDGARPAFADAGLNTLFDRSLIVVKHAQNPALGPFPATTNPVAYDHRSWMRDSSLTAIALDASQHFAEAAVYWRWMANAQEANGTWRTVSRCVGWHADLVREPRIRQRCHAR